MKKSDFSYHLPQRLIAQTPASPRDASRLLCLRRGSEEMHHHHFFDLPTLLQPGDLLVLNNTKVLPARLLGRKEGMQRSCELLLLQERETDVWECLAKPGKRIRPGDTLLFGGGVLQAYILETLPNGGKLVRFSHRGGTLYEVLDTLGEMPLPPYIESRQSRPEDYQTVYAKQRGSAAAPTAGLHFTQDLFARLRDAGITTAELTLHVGLGTFRPVQEEEVENHPMHSEWYEIGEQAAEAIRRTKRQGGRVIAVGTTSCRTLEAVAAQYGEIRAASGETDIFITPGHTFKAIDGLLTNFHLPESTLLMLVSAFYGRENTLRAYSVAIEQQYRFYSFGDAMLIL
ncbi:tRNA preQ1(34) S-adenosylmethionine ribosyltransferase-isomerase QueA [Ruminococcaceae bacterium OttesenSCG-928-I18]|nr:tRNA preQ1(34) S-adenosylmethionine ribosyltransferase-isomerase QueA [Ruminococcaceae bacterium OttesenSCG-928-I18]